MSTFMGDKQKRRNSIVLNKKLQNKLQNLEETRVICREQLARGGKYKLDCLSFMRIMNTIDFNGVARSGYWRAITKQRAFTG